MSFAIPAVVKALVRDRALGRLDALVFVGLCDILDNVEFREASLAQIEHDTGIDPSNISRSLKRLVSGGYVIRGGRSSPRGPFTYRIPLSPRPIDAPPTVAAAARGTPPRRWRHVVDAGVDE